MIGGSFRRLLPFSRFHVISGQLGRPQGSRGGRKGREETANVRDGINGKKLRDGSKRDRASIHTGAKKKSKKGDFMHRQSLD